MQPTAQAAKRRKNAAHGASRGWKVEPEQAPKGRKRSYDRDSGGATEVLTHTRKTSAVLELLYGEARNGKGTASQAAEKVSLALDFGWRSGLPLR
jgi:hypothetical protein